MVNKMESLTSILPSTIIKVLHIFKLNENLSLTVVNYQLKLKITKTFFETPVTNSLNEILDMIIDNQTNISYSLFFKLVAAFHPHLCANFKERILLQFF